MRRDRLSAARFGSLILATTWAVAGATEPPRLELAGLADLVHGEPAISMPCFRITADILEPSGAAQRIELPPEGRLASSLTVKIGGYDVSPFYAVVDAAGREQEPSRIRISLVLIDVSGSMNELLPSGQTRFEAARAAAAHFLGNFEAGLDRVSIVGWGSHDVAGTIRAGQFVGEVAEARRMIDTLAVPTRANNTALFSAIETGIDVLKEQMAAAPDRAEALLVVMTDGKNYVGAGDDPGLLNGPAGLEVVAEKVRKSKLDVVAIGLGDSASIDEESLRRISSRIYVVQEGEALKQAFYIPRHLPLGASVRRITATIVSPWEDRATLAGRTFGVQLLLRLSDGTTLSTHEVLWAAPQIGIPIYTGSCSQAEMKAFLAAYKSSSPGENLVAVERPVVITLAFLVLLAIFWFWIPRFMWSDQYSADLQAIQARARWVAAGPQTAQTAGPRSARAAPSGFDHHDAGGRSPTKRDVADVTIMRPIDSDEFDRRK